MQEYDYYPALAGLAIAAGFTAEDPDGYLEGPNCPYDAPTKAALRRIAAGRRGESEAPAGVAVEAPDIETEAISLYQELKAFRERVKDSGEVGDQAAAFRVANSLLEKLLNMRERAHTLKETIFWKRKILQIIGEVLTDEQRIAFDQRLTAEIEAAR